MQEPYFIFLGKPDNNQPNLSIIFTSLLDTCTILVDRYCVIVNGHSFISLYIASPNHNVIICCHVVQSRIWTQGGVS